MDPSDPSTVLITIVNILAASTTVAAAITAYSNRHKARAEAAATASSTATAAVDNAMAAQTVAITSSVARADRLAATVERHEKKMDAQEKEMSVLRQEAREAKDRLHALELEREGEKLSRARLLNTFSAAIRYIKDLRLQLEAISTTPLPWPMQLEDWLTAYGEENKPLQ